MTQDNMREVSERFSLVGVLNNTINLEFFS